MRFDYFDMRAARTARTLPLRPTRARAPCVAKAAPREPAHTLETAADRRVERALACRLLLAFLGVSVPRRPVSALPASGSDVDNI